MTDLIRRWWQQPDHYYWLATYLTSHGAQPATRAVMATTVLSLGAIPAIMTRSPSGPPDDRGKVTALIIALCCVAMAGLWLRRRWPSRAQSAAFVVTSEVCTAVACVIEANPLTALMGCTAFAAIGGYIAFFHSARYMLFNAAAAVATAGYLTHQLFQVDQAAAIAKVILVIVANVSVPFACQSLLQILGVDILNSDIDPLTGLQNRRAFYRLASEFVGARDRIQDRYLTFIMIDLDKFKRLNDTHGHAMGDRALIAIGRALRENTRRSAVVARVGGEEFLIADTFSHSDVAMVTDRLLGAIATTPPRLSASVGTATIPMAGLARIEPQVLIESLINSADEAMYEAKRAGGNQAKHRHCKVDTLI